MRANIAMTLIATGLLASCAPSEQQYDAAITVLQGSQRARTEVLNDCVKRMSATDATWHHNAAVVMNVSEKDAPRVACGRYLKALVSGRATYQDTLDLSNRRYTPKLIKIFQGSLRRKTGQSVATTVHARGLHRPCEPDLAYRPASSADIGR